MTRRKMLKALGLGAAALTIPAFVRRAGAVPPNSMPSGSVLDETGMSILHAAAAAPSSHNTQPWRVQIVEPHRWVVCADESRWLKVVDPARRELVLSLGTFVENLVLAAGAAGYRAEVAVRARDLMDTEFVEVRLAEDAPTDFPLRRIHSRRTIRKGYLSKPLPDSVVRQLTGAFTRAVFYPVGSREATLLAQGTVAAFTAQTNRDDAQAELARWVRFSESDVRRHGDGLTPATMEIGGVGGWFVRRFMTPQDVMKRSFRDKGIEIARRQAGEGAGWIVATTDGQTPAELIAAGREYERMLLPLREQNLAAHPMSQMLEEDPWRGSLASDLGTDGMPQFIIRVGYVENYPGHTSPRRPPESFVDVV